MAVDDQLATRQHISHISDGERGHGPGQSEDRGKQIVRNQFQDEENIAGGQTQEIFRQCLGSTVQLLKV